MPPPSDPSCFPVQAATQAIVLDTLYLAVLLLAVGLPAYALVRHFQPLLQWERRGNVWTSPFLGTDILAVALLAFAARSMIVAGAVPGTPRTYTAGSILLSSILFLMVAGCLVAMMAYRRASLMELFGLDRIAPWPLVWKAALICAVSVAVTSTAGHLMDAFVHHAAWRDEGNQDLVRLLRQSPDAGLRLAIVITACVFQPVAEEIIFRGYVYAAVKRFTERYFAACISALLFATLHHHALALVPIFLFGLILAAAYEWSGSLWLPIAVHAFFNTTTVIGQLVLPS